MFIKKFREEKSDASTYDLFAVPACDGVFRKTCIRVVPSFDQSYLNLAQLYALRNDKEKAKGVLQDLLRIQPQNQSAIQALEILNAVP